MDSGQWTVGNRQQAIKKRIKQIEQLTPVGGDGTPAGSVSSTSLMRFIRTGRTAVSLLIGRLAAVKKIKLLVRHGKRSSLDLALACMNV